jgi:murein DD-endopeptidase MepM/ murein hydrolase activator NlpD
MKQHSFTAYQRLHFAHKRLFHYSMIAFFVGAVLVLLTVNTPKAQGDCGVVDNMIMPVDTTAFRLVQDYRVSSPRHDGRFHTGEDWYGGRETTFGQAVRAIANGRVTYAYDLAWGRDGGVVIVEHTLPNDSIIYSVYGHLQSTNTMPLPQRLDCISTGQVIGAIGDARPAPHLHFEIRDHLRDTPGPGYTTPDPQTEGWQNPSRFVTNWQARLLRAHEWALDVDLGAPLARYAPSVTPVALNDNSIVYADSANRTLRRATADGRILWRQDYETDIAGISGFQGRVLVFFTDGRVQAISAEDGGRRDDWQLAMTLDQGMFEVGEWLVFGDGDGGLVAIDETRRAILWRMNDIGRVVRSFVAGEGLNIVIGVINDQQELVQISGSGSFINRAQLRAMGSFARADDGTLLAYGLGGLWRISLDGTWSLEIIEPTSQNASNAAYVTEGGRIYLYDGQNLHAFNRDEAPLWQLTLEGVTGYSTLTQYGAFLLLTSTGGDIIALNDGGRLCQRTKIQGSEGYRVWHDLGDDGILRIALADQIIAFDWATFTQACNAQ